MKPYFGRNDSHLAYLEPPHLHDPLSVSGVASLPLQTLERLPTAVQSALYNLQQSTSIVYASYVRLQDLLQERFDRLIPSIDVDGDIMFSESSFFNYVNSLCAERTYLLSDAHPDWRHKASLARVAVQPYHDLLLSLEPADLQVPSSVLQWWDCLQSAVESWCEYARVVHVPDLEDTIAEYLATQRQPPALALDLDDTPLETPLATPTPTLEKEHESLQLYDIKDKDFECPLLAESVPLQKATGLGLVGTVDMGGFTTTVTPEFLLKDEGKVRDERKDSGVGMAG